jgi:hypothetical protein
MGLFKKLIKPIKKVVKASTKPLKTTKRVVSNATHPVRSAKRAVKSPLDPLAGLASKKNTIHSKGDINRVSVERNPGNTRFLRPE